MHAYSSVLDAICCLTLDSMCMCTCTCTPYLPPADVRTPCAQRERYDATGRVEKSVEEEFSDSFAGGEHPPFLWLC